MDTHHNWPVLDFRKMQATVETLHQWLQIVGKIRLKTMPWQNHSWHTSLYLSPAGFTTQNIPFEGRSFEIEFDFIRHKLLITCSNAAPVEIRLYSRTVADFYRELFEKLGSVGIHVSIHGSPNEVEPAVPFAENTSNKTYDPAVANALWRAMSLVNEVFSKFRSDFVGKVSPVHLFWGAFDLAVTRFSGRPAPLHPGGMPNMPLDVMQEAYSQEVSSAGFWPGSRDFPTPVFYAYTYPENPEFRIQRVQPEEAFYSPDMGEFLLEYEHVRSSDNPAKTLMAFLQTTYEAAANTANWNRAQLERPVKQK